MIPTCIVVVALFPGPCRSSLHDECRGYNNNNNNNNNNNGFYYSDVHTSHPADTMAYKSLIQKDIHLIISLHNNNMLPNLLTIRYSTTMVISSWSSVRPGTCYIKVFPLYCLHSHAALFWWIFPRPAATQILSELAPSTWAEGLWLPSGLGNPHRSAPHPLCNGAVPPLRRASRDLCTFTLVLCTFLDHSLIIHL